MNPFGGMRMVEQSLEEYGFKMNEDIKIILINIGKHTIREFLMLIVKLQGKQEQWAF